MSYSHSNKSLKISWKEIHKNSTALAALLKAKGPWNKIVAITRGGLIPAAIISKELNIRVIDTVSIESYRNKKRSKPTLLKRLQDNEGDTLIIDDVVDTGKTVLKLKKIYPNAHYAAVYAKPAGAPFVDTYVKNVPQESWVVFPWER